MRALRRTARRLEKMPTPLKLSVICILLSATLALAAWIGGLLHLSTAVSAIALGFLAVLVFGPPSFVLGQRLDSLRDQSLTDPLTAIGNRRLLQSRLLEEFARSMRTNRPVSLLMIDLDGLKQVNDQLGHGCGDAMLRYLADTLARCTRISDVIGRHGGDEFLIVAPETSSQVGRRLAARIISASHKHHAGIPPMKISVGLATSTTSTSSAEALLKAADQAMYEAKHRGGDRLVVARDASADRTSWVNPLVPRGKAHQAPN